MDSTAKVRILDSKWKTQERILKIKRPKNKEENDKRAREAHVIKDVRAKS